MKITATFKGDTKQFLTSVKGTYLPALGSDGNMYFFMPIKDMGELTRLSAINGEKGYIDETKTCCFVLCEERKLTREEGVKFFKHAETLEDFIRLRETV